MPSTTSQSNIYLWFAHDAKQNSSPFVEPKVEEVEQTEVSVYEYAEEYELGEEKSEKFARALARRIERLGEQLEENRIEQEDIVYIDLVMSDRNSEILVIANQGTVESDDGFTLLTTMHIETPSCSMNVTFRFDPSEKQIGPFENAVLTNHNGGYQIEINQDRITLRSNDESFVDYPEGIFRAYQDIINTIRGSYTSPQEIYFKYVSYEDFTHYVRELYRIELGREVPRIYLSDEEKALWIKVVRGISDVNLRDLMERLNHGEVR